MPTYTEHYQLHQWVPEDHFLRTDFNQDFQTLDRALAALRQAVDRKAEAAALEDVRAIAAARAWAGAGSYVGDGNSPREINLGAQPKAVFLLTPAAGFFTFSTSGTMHQLTITGQGFRLEPGALQLNNSGARYTYLSIV